MLWSICPRMPARGSAAAGAEAAVVAEGAAAGGDGAIDIGAGEAGVDADFLHAAGTKFALKEVPVGVKAEAGGFPVGNCSVSCLCA